MASCGSPEDKWIGRIGMVCAAALVFPLLGAEFGRRTGVHPRLVAYGCSALLVLVGVAMRHRRAVSVAQLWGVHLLMGLAGMSILLTLPWGGPLWRVTEVPTVELYPAHKLTRLLLTSCPAIVGAVAVAPLVRHREFLAGLQRGVLAIACLGVAEVVAFAALLGSGSHADWVRFSDDAGFSTISLSMLLVFGLLAAQGIGRRFRGRTGSLFVGVAVVCAVFGTFALAQRTSLALCVLFALLPAARRGGRWASGRLTAVLTIAGLLLLAAVILDPANGGYGTQTRRVESLLALGDTSSQARMRMWVFAAEGFVRAPLGHGFGSFARHYAGHLYPHNVLAEAAFELGILGLGAFVGLAWVSVVLVVRTVRGELRFYGLCLATGLLWVMKAGDLSAVGHWIGWLYLAAAAWRAPSLGPADRWRDDPREISPPGRRRAAERSGRGATHL